ncbi:MAG: YceI family protein [Bacteroidota bacterium]|nr:YceI family protein [Bacteroidota bacterium]
MKKYLYRFSALLFLFVVASAFAVLQLKPVDSENAVTFVIKNLGINTKGELSGLKGTIEWNEESPADSKFAITAAANTINTGIDTRDNHLKREEYFDAEHYPEIKIMSNSIAKTDNGFTMNATLTIKSISKNISFPFTAEKKPDGYLFGGKFAINRRDFGIGGNSVTLSDNVEVSLNVTAK